MISVSSKVLSLSAEASLLVRSGRVVYSNPAADSFFGVPCVGKSMKELFPDEISAAQAGSFCAETTVGGRRCCVRTSRADDMQVYFIAESLAAPMLVNDAFIYSMRSSLMNMRLSAELGRAKAAAYADAELDEDLNRLMRDHFRMSRLLENAAAVRALSSGETAVIKKPLDLSKLCRDIIDTVSLLRSDIGFSLSCGDSLCVSADKSLVELLIFNLISNCLTHAEGLEHVTISLMPCGSAVMLSVSDDGAGIPEDVMPQVFERYRAPYEIRTLSRGAGLGLSVVRAVAQVHNGTLMLESRPGRGTSARVTFAGALQPSSLQSLKVEFTDGMRAVLTGLADCLPDECFSAKYMD